MSVNSWLSGWLTQSPVIGADYYFTLANTRWLYSSQGKPAVLYDEGPMLETLDYIISLNPRLARSLKISWGFLKFDELSLSFSIRN